MNAFIRLRNSYLDPDDLNLFSLAHIDEIKRSREMSRKENSIIEYLQCIVYLRQKNTLTQEEMIDLLKYLGTNIYINSYVVELFIKNKALFGTAIFKTELAKRLKKPELVDEVVYALIDSCIECDYDFVSEDLLLSLLKSEGLSLDTFSLIINYIHYFHIVGFKQAIYSWLKKDYPITIKLQLIDVLVEFHSVDELKDNLLNKISLNQNERPMIKNYITNLKKETQYLKQGFTVLQSMFYGDFENSGKGNNGGLSIFLKTLGNELSKSENIARVITLTITNKWSENQSLLKNYSESHLFVSVPIYLKQDKVTEFLQKEYLIKRTISRFLERYELEPDVYHVRFLDNASRAMAGLCKEQRKKLVVTLTPDPHRNMTDETGVIKLLSFNETLENFNKIVIGDELIAMSDKIVGIGNYSVKKELEKYFPQLLTAVNERKVRMISEGIQIDLSLMQKGETALTDMELEEMGLTKEFLEQPIILNVGRLNKLKAQDQLLKAWGNSKLSEIYHLLIIGGDLSNPDSEEQQMIEKFAEYIQENPSLEEKFLHLGALSNYQVRKLEKRIRKEQKTYPQLYICSSKKEEFGIAILEALSQQFLVLGPEKGGVKSYLENGVNGFLIDTTNWQSIADAVVNKVLPLKNQPTVFEKIQLAGKQKVKENFSMTTIVDDFLSLYLALDDRSDSNEN